MNQHSARLDGVDVPARVACDVILLAAGRGERLGEDVPKARVPLLGIPLFLHSLRTLCRHPLVDQLFLVVSPEDGEERIVWRSIEANLEPAERDRLRIVSGGQRRQDSVRSGLEGLLEMGTSEDRIILIHDAARPLITPALIDRCLLAISRPIQRGRQTELPGLAGRGSWGERPAGVIPALPMRETLKLVFEGRVVLTQPRENLYAVQTPQCFYFGPILRAHRKATEYNLEVNDDAALLEWQGIPVYVVPGESTNLKVTFPEDLDLAARILQGLRYDPPQGAAEVQS